MQAAPVPSLAACCCARPTHPTCPPCRLTFLQLIGFGLSLFTKASNEARLNLLAKGLPGLVVMLGLLVPTLGDYYGVNGKKGSSSSGGSKQ
jgi:hypothetical protein